MSCNPKFAMTVLDNNGASRVLLKSDTLTWDAIKEHTNKKGFSPLLSFNPETLRKYGLDLQPFIDELYSRDKNDTFEKETTRSFSDYMPQQPQFLEALQAIISENTGLPFELRDRKLFLTGKIKKNKVTIDSQRIVNYMKYAKYGEKNVLPNTLPFVNKLIRNKNNGEGKLPAYYSKLIQGHETAISVRNSVDLKYGTANYQSSLLLEKNGYVSYLDLIKNEMAYASGYIDHKDTPLSAIPYVSYAEMRATDKESLGRLTNEINTYLKNEVHPDLEMNNKLELRMSKKKGHKYPSSITIDQGKIKEIVRSWEKTLTHR